MMNTTQDLLYCVSCEECVTDTAHESRCHDGAQTVWPLSEVAIPYEDIDVDRLDDLRQACDTEADEPLPCDSEAF